MFIWLRNILKMNLFYPQKKNKKNSDSDFYQENTEYWSIIQFIHEGHLLRQNKYIQCI